MRELKSLLFTEYNYNNHIKYDEVGGTCGTHVGDKKCQQNLVGKHGKRNLRRPRYR
jgi:hypothetical protein